MRILYVVQRYGADVAGGAEQHCRQFATRMAARGHHVEVLTTCAVDARTWEDRYPAGDEQLDGVTVHRLSTPRIVDERLYDTLGWEVLWSGRRVPPALVEVWLRAQGPVSTVLVPWLADRSAGFDVAVFFTYLFWTTWAGLRTAGGRVPTVLHATAHDERPFWLPIYDTELRSPDAYAWSTEEERDLLRLRGAGAVPGSVIGVGMDPAPRGADEHGFRARHGLGDRPYLLVLGRVDPGKGSTDLAEWFAAYKRRRPGPLALVFVGERAVAVPAHPDVVATGFVSDAERTGALRGALALVQPSWFESFSMVLAEAWAAGKPAVVQARNPVLAAQARRSGGALPFEGYVDLEVALDALRSDPELAARLGQAGRRYVEHHYNWERVLARYERLLTLARRRFAARGRRRPPGHLIRGSAA